MCSVRVSSLLELILEVTGAYVNGNRVYSTPSASLQPFSEKRPIYPDSGHDFSVHTHWLNLEVREIPQPLAGEGCLQLNCLPMRYGGEFLPGIIGQSAEVGCGKRCSAALRE